MFDYLQKTLKSFYRFTPSEDFIKDPGTHICKRYVAFSTVSKGDQKTFLSIIVAQLLFSSCDSLHKIKNTPYKHPYASQQLFCARVSPSGKTNPWISSNLGLVLCSSFPLAQVLASTACSGGSRCSSHCHCPVCPWLTQTTSVVSAQTN